MRPTQLCQDSSFDAIQTATMPPEQHKKLKDLIEQEGRILLAISAIQKDQVSGPAEAACVFNVPQSTLHNRINGSKNQHKSCANGYKLSITEKDSIVQ